MGRYNLKSVHFTQIEDIFMLQKSGFIGEEIKPSLLAGTALLFSGPQGSGGAIVRIYGMFVEARLLAPSKIPDAALHDIIYGASHTLFKAREIRVNLDPLYTAEEIACA